MALAVVAGGFVTQNRDIHFWLVRLHAEPHNRASRESASRSGDTLTKRMLSDMGGVHRGPLGCRAAHWVNPLPLLQAGASGRSLFFS